MKRWDDLVLFLVSTLIVLFHCSPSDSPVTGGTIETTNGAIAGICTTPDSIAVAHAHVSLYKDDIQKSNYTPQLIAETKTDSLGVYRFTRLSSGVYDIVTLSPDSLLVQYTPELIVDDKNKEIDAGVQILTEASSLTLSTTMHIPVAESTYVEFLNTPWANVVSGLGPVSLTLIPPGTYTCRYGVYLTKKDYQLKVYIYIDTIMVSANKKIVLDSLRTPLYAPDFSTIVFADFEEGQLRSNHNSPLVLWTPDSTVCQFEDPAKEKATLGGADSSLYSMRVLWTKSSQKTIASLSISLNKNNHEVKIPGFLSYDLSNLDSLSFDMKGSPAIITPSIRGRNSFYTMMFDTVHINNTEWKQVVVYPHMIQRDTSSADTLDHYRILDKLFMKIENVTHNDLSENGEISIDNIKFHF